MIFVFSIAVVSPYLSKKDLVGILVMGFIIGSIGGIFFISPIYDDFPVMVGTVDAMITGENEYINVDLSSQSDNNISDMNNKIKDIEGVKEVTPSQVTIITNNFSSSYEPYMKIGIEHNINQSPQVNNATIDSETGTINVSVKNNTDPIVMVDDLEEFLLESYDLPSLSSVVRLQAHVDVNDVDDVQEKMEQNTIPFSSVEGPVESYVNSNKDSQLPLWMVYIVCGVIGVIFAVLGMVIDKIYYGWKNASTKSRKSVNTLKNKSNTKFKKDVDIEKYKKDLETSSEEPTTEIVEDGNVHTVEDIPADVEDKKSKLDNIKNEDESQELKELKEKTKVKDSDDLNDSDEEKTLDDFKED